VRRFWRWPAAALMAVAGRRRRGGEDDEDSHRVVPAGPSNPGSEAVVAMLLFLAALSAVGFIVVYSLERFSGQHELLGVTLGVAFAFVAAALVTLGKRVTPNEELEDAYPEVEHPEEQESLAAIVEEPAAGITRKKLLAAAGGTAGGAIGLAALTPALSLGPWFDVDPLYRTPWKRGRRLVDDKGTPYRADEIEPDTYYTAFPEGASHRNLGSPLVVVRVDPKHLKLPLERIDWAPQGILAFSKVCPHAGCPIALYRKPTYPPEQPRPALVCPCHYSTFDPATGGELIFGPAGRALPQLPVAVDPAGELRAQGDFSGPIGPGWWGVRSRGRPS
jgi:ubiquinol-cytochrome c reductase iron-sulfur subunit